MIACTSGANTIWPNELPALMNPAANERRSTGTCCATAPIRIPKLPAPAPHAVRIPSVRISPHSLVTRGVIAEPSASIRLPAMTTRTVPYLSAMAPKIGCDTPQTNWPIASAKLILTMPSCVAVLIGDTNRPVVTREPIVIIRIAAAAIIRIHAARADISVFEFIGASFEKGIEQDERLIDSRMQVENRCGAERAFELRLSGSPGVARRIDDAPSGRRDRCDPLARIAPRLQHHPAGIDQRFQVAGQRGPLGVHPCGEGSDRHRLARDPAGERILRRLDPGFGPMVGVKARDGSRQLAQREAGAADGLGGVRHGGCRA